MGLDVYLTQGGHEVYWSNITHNLNKMAAEAQIYKPLWRPDEHNFEFACDLLEPLSYGLALLLDRPDHFRQFNAENGWGMYEGFLDFVEKYLDACIEYPDAVVSVSR